METFKKFITNSRKPKVHTAFIGLPHKSDSLFSEELGYDRLKYLNTIENHIKSDHLQGSFEKNKRKLTKTEHASIRDYSGASHKILNKHLFTNKSVYHGNIMSMKDNNKKIRHISQGIKKHVSDRNFHVFSGMRSPEGLKSHNGYIHVKNPAFTSTSIDPFTAYGFSKHPTQKGKQSEHSYNRNGEKYDPNNESHNKSDSYFMSYSHMAKIHIPKGSRGLFMKSISQHSGENEYLLNKRSQFAFKEKPTVDHKHRIVIWHGKLTHDGYGLTRHGKAMGLK